MFSTELLVLVTTTVSRQYDWHYDISWISYFKIVFMLSIPKSLYEFFPFFFFQITIIPSMSIPTSKTLDPPLALHIHSPLSTAADLFLLWCRFALAILSLPFVGIGRVSVRLPRVRLFSSVPSVHHKCSAEGKMHWNCAPLWVDLVDW